jgi:PAS domain S-box-containing protein
MPSLKRGIRLAIWRPPWGQELKAGIATGTVWTLEGATLMAAIVRVDRNGKISHWNTAAERLFGFTKLEAIGNSVELIIPPQSHACHRQGFARYVETGTSALPEAVITIGRHKNGQPIRVQISVRALVDDRGKIAEVEGVMLAGCK